MKFSELAAGYREYMAVRGRLSERTIENMETVHGKFAGYLQMQGLQDDVRNFNPETVDGFATALVTVDRNGPNSINVKLAYLSSLGKYGMKVKKKDGRGYVLDENPLVRVERPRRQKPQEKYLFKAELQALLGLQAPANERIALDAVIDLNLRATEIAEAKVKQLALDGDRLKLTVPVKGGNFKEITLGREFGEQLMEFLKFREARPDDPILVNRSGLAYTRTSLTDMVFRLAQKAGITRIPVRAHVIRHSIATLADDLGISVKTIAGMLNHSDMSTVQRYVHERGSKVTEARDAVREALRG